MTTELLNQLLLLQQGRIKKGAIKIENMLHFLKLASNNRVLYALLDKLLQEKLYRNKVELIELKKIGDEYQNKLRKTIIFIRKKLDKAEIPFLVAKTYRPLEYVTVDVDILTKRGDFEHVKQVLSAVDAEIRECYSKKQVDIIVPGLLRIDLHKGFFWQKSTFLDEELPWKRVSFKQIAGVTVPIPNLETEVILMLLNLLYERMYIPLLEYLFLRYTSQKVDWNVIWEQAKRYRWNQALTIILKKFNLINQPLYSEPLLRDGKILTRDIKCNKLIDLPWIFSFRDIGVIFRERLIKRQSLALKDLAYFVFSKTRFHFTQKERVPIYGHWFDFNRLGQDKR